MHLKHPVTYGYLTSHSIPSSQPTTNKMFVNAEASTVSAFATTSSPVSGDLLRRASSSFLESPRSFSCNYFNSQAGPHIHYLLADGELA